MRLNTSRGDGTWKTERSHQMGDKGGKKDKNKDQKQKLGRQEDKAKKQQDKQRDQKQK